MADNYYAKRKIEIRDIRNLGAVLGLKVSTNWFLLCELIDALKMKI